VPKSLALSSANELDRVEEAFDFPVMVKGLFYDAYIAYNNDQVRNHFNRISAKWGFPVIVQEFVKGTEVNVIALGDGTGKTVGAVPMRKQYITDKGKAWGGITLDSPAMMDLASDLIKKTRWRGGMELELIRTADQRLYLIEINPRLPAWLYLAVGAGQNLPEALLKLALGMEVEPMTHYDVGRMFVRYSYDMIVNIEQFQKISVNGEL
jgi:carbamoyl-phosphate synthase large subunit